MQFPEAVDLREIRELQVVGGSLTHHKSRVQSPSMSTSRIVLVSAFSAYSALRTLTTSVKASARGLGPPDSKDLPMLNPTIARSQTNRIINIMYSNKSHSRILRACECHLWMMIACIVHYQLVTVLQDFFARVPQACMLATCESLSSFDQLKELRVLSMCAWSAHLYDRAAVQVDVQVVLHHSVQKSSRAHGGNVWPQTDLGLNFNCHSCRQSWFPA
jgi:hypothetical protein